MSEAKALLAHLQKLKQDILDSNNFDSLCKLHSNLKKQIVDMEQKIADAHAIQSLEVYEKIDDEFVLFRNSLETIKIQSKEVLLNEMKLLQERYNRLQNGTSFFEI